MGRKRKEINGFRSYVFGKLECRRWRKRLYSPWRRFIGELSKVRFVMDGCRFLISDYSPDDDYEMKCIIKRLERITSP